MKNIWLKYASVALTCIACAGVQAKVPVLNDETDFMKGFPIQKETQVTADNFMQAPYNRWGFQHIREIHPTSEVYKGDKGALPFEYAPVDLEAKTFSLGGGREIGLNKWLDESYTDSFLVLHKGKIIYEKYLNGMQPHSQHQMFSATKSFVATLTLLLIDEGLIVAEKGITSYLPELEDSAYRDATVQQVLDMTVSINFNEDYSDSNADIWKYGHVFAVNGQPPQDYKGPRTIYDYLPTLSKSSLEHGEAFHYVTPHTDVLAWLNSRVSGETLSQLMSDKFWKQLGVERDGYLWLGNGTEMAGGGLNITARDAARFGQMILQGGYYNKQQIMPEKVAKRILKSGDHKIFTRINKDPWYEDVAYAYHDMWWTFNNSHKAVSAVGVHGQFIYIDPVAQMVVVKQSSHPEALSETHEVSGPQIWHQISEYLMTVE